MSSTLPIAPVTSVDLEHHGYSGAPGARVDAGVVVGAAAGAAGGSAGRAGDGGRFLSRRAMLTAGALATTAALLPRAARAQGVQAPAAPLAITKAGSGKRPTNVILLVADGMTTGALAMLDASTIWTNGETSAWTRWSQSKFARRALQSTHSANSIVTDSAAASSAWSTGIKHENGSLCMMPDGKALEPLWIKAQRAGKLTGCVTTTTITHATPAGFYCNVTKRGSEDQIGEQLCQRPVHVAMGGGTPFVAESDAKAAGNTALVRTRQELAEAISSTGAAASASVRLIGTFNTGHMSMALDRGPNEPALMEMARVALSRLTSPAVNSSGFCLQIEGGRVDHAGHANDAAGLLADLYEFDRVVDYVCQWAMDRGDTLVVVTTDHGTGGCSPIFYGRHGIECLKRLSGAKHSFDWIFRELGSLNDPKADAARLVKITQEAVGFSMASDAEEIIRKFMANEYAVINPMQRSLTCVLGSLLTSQLGVAFSTNGHNADHTDLYAMGPGSETLPAFVDNTFFAGWVSGMLELRPV
jgi:alkaline phosphatase